MSAGTARSGRLVADIGGSNARFGWVCGPGGAVEHIRVLPVQDFAGPTEAAQHYLSGLGAVLGQAARPQCAGIAVATTVDADEVVFTNSPWRFSQQGFRAAIGVDALHMFNDFAALAHALPSLGAGQMRAWGSELPQPQGCLAVIGPGTGLGVAGLLQTRGGWVTLPSEGGHATLAAAEGFEAEVLAHARGQFPHVSAERLLSGIGLPLLHASVQAVLGLPAASGMEALLSAERILELGLAGTDPVCERSLALFCAMLGGFAGNVALILGARGGVYVAGGIVPRLGEFFFRSAFRERFEAKGRLAPYLAAIPTVLITDTFAALTGVAAAIDRNGCS